MRQGKRIYICNNADLPCKYHEEKTGFQLRDGEDERCPACRKADITLVRTGDIITNGRRGMKKAVLISLGILLTAFAGWKLIATNHAGNGSGFKGDKVPSAGTNKDSIKSREKAVIVDSTRLHAGRQTENNGDKPLIKNPDKKRNSNSPDPDNENTNRSAAGTKKRAVPNSDELTPNSSHDPTKHTIHVDKSKHPSK